MSLFDIDFKNVYKKVDHMLISMYVIKVKIDRLLVGKYLIGSLCIKFLFIRIIWFYDLKEKNRKKLF